MDSKYIFILLTCLIFAATDAQKVNRKKRQTWGGGKRQGNGLTNWSGSRTQSQNTWGTFTTTSRPRFNWRRNNFPRQNGFTGMGGGRSGGGWSNNNNNFPGMGGLQNMFAAASGHFMGDQQRMEAAIMAGTFARPLGGMSFDKTFDRSPPKIIPYGCPPGARQFVCTGFNPCEVGPCRRYPSARCWVNACGGCSPEWWTHTFQRVMDCD